MRPGRPMSLAIGERSGALVLMGFLRRDKRNNWILDCECGCGARVEIVNTAFRTRSACKACTKISGPMKRTKHGASKRGTRDPLYSAFRAMHARCYNKNMRSYRWYGAKGIKVCQEWHDFAVFREWATANGFEPGLTLDREFEDQDYCPSNCSYLTQSENSRRMRAKYHFVPKSTVFYNEPTFGDF